MNEKQEERDELRKRFEEEAMGLANAKYYSTEKADRTYSWHLFDAGGLGYLALTYEGSHSGWGRRWFEYLEHTGSLVVDTDKS